MNLVTKLIPLAVAPFVLTTVVGAPQNATDKLEGKKIPAFSMKTIEGKTITDKTLQGKVVLVDFWASWCGPCKKASPLMEELHKKYASKGLVVIGASGMEDDPSAKPAINYKKEHKYTYTFTYNNDALMDKWGVKGIPQFVLIGKDGVVKETYFGYSDAIGKNMAAAVASQMK